MNQIVTQGIVLSRTDYGEADRIITFLTPDQGKVRVMAKGVRKSKAKLAGSVELFGVSDITFIAGRSEIYTLISARLIKHYGGIISEIGRLQAGYDVVRLLHRATEDNPPLEYFRLLNEALAGLDDKSAPPEAVMFWFQLHLLKLAGHAPDFTTDTKGQKLSPDKTYNFDTESMRLAPSPARKGQFGVNEIKFWRLGLSAAHPQLLAKVQDSELLIISAQPTLKAILSNYVRL